MSTSFDDKEFMFTLPLSARRPDSSAGGHLRELHVDDMQEKKEFVKQAKLLCHRDAVKSVSRQNKTLIQKSFKRSRAKKCQQQLKNIFSSP